MVWSMNTRQLEEAVRRHNDENALRHDFQPAPPEPLRAAPEESAPPSFPPPPKEHFAETPPPCEECNRCPRCAAPQSRPQNAPGQLFGDRDALLLIGLILILMNEKADSKLILALAFVLLA